MDGRIVQLNSSSFRTPSICCSCGAASQLNLRTSHRKGRVGGGSTTLHMDFPYCLPCSERVKSFRSKQTLTIVIALGACAVVGGLVFAVSALPVVVAGVLALVIGVGATVGAVLGMKPPPPSGPVTSRGEAVRILNFNGSMTTIYCTNAQWGDNFAGANNVQARPKTKGDGFGVGAIVTAVILAPIAGYGAWFGAHPTVHVDNATADSLNIYIDGKKAMTVGPNTHDDMSVGYGKHTFGWSKSDASAPTGTTDVKVQVNDAHLYNPNKSACYYLRADAYGSASVDGLQQGVQPIQEFYHFDKVDNWFSNNPQSIEVQNGNGGTQVALQRWKLGMDAADHGCSLDARNQLVACWRAAKDDNAFDVCAKPVVATCGGGTAPSVQPAAHGGTAPAAHPATAAHPAAAAPATPPKKK